jgi:hypothetical protein
VVRVSKETRRLIQAAAEILAVHHPMTVRQVYYQLVANQVIRNNRSQYQAVSKVLVRARRWGGIPWHWIEDRLRRPRKVPCWQDLAAFSVTVENAYSRDVWSAQAMYLEVWLEKDALSGIFEDTLAPYGITLNVGRGYDGWDSIHNAALRYGGSGKPVTVLYFGDLDPSGEDMVRSLRQRLAELDCRPTVIKCALTLEDVERYSLPPDFTKTTETRRAAFIAEYGDVAVELDALPADVLRDRLVSEIEARMDMSALSAVRQLEQQERDRLAVALASLNR